MVYVLYMQSYEAIKENIKCWTYDIQYSTHKNRYVNK